MCVSHSVTKSQTKHQKQAGGHSTLHQGVANEEPGVGYCKRTCLGMHLGTLVAAGGPTYKPYKSCFNHSLRLLPGTSQVVHGLFQKYLLLTHRFTFAVHD